MKLTYEIVDQKLVQSSAQNCPIVVYIQPDERERGYLIDELKIDEHTFSSALDPDELPRLEFEPEHVAVIFKRPRNYSNAQQIVFGVSSTGVFLFKDRLRLVTGDEAGLFDGAPIVRVQSLSGLILRLLSRAVIHFREHLGAIQRVSEELQSEINRAMENKHLISMFSLQKSLVYYVNAIGSNTALLERLRTNSARIGFTTEENELLDDLIIENQQCFRQAEMYSNILASLMDARASIVANNLNVLMKTLNVITISIMVPTLVVSTFSMNVNIPFDDQPFAFWMVVALALASAVGFLYLWKRWGR